MPSILQARHDQMFPVLDESEIARVRRFGFVCSVGGGGVVEKAGEIGFTKALAQEGARSGITVNAIAPGYVNTEMVQAVPKDVLEKSILPTIPIGRLGEPEEIGRCVVVLASDDAGLITGSTLTANGGNTLHKHIRRAPYVGAIAEGCAGSRVQIIVLPIISFRPRGQRN